MTAPPARRRARRKLSLLGGTTNAADCLVALGYLLLPPLARRGPVLARYEEAFARRVGVRHAVTFSSGRVGLFGLLQALGVGQDDEVLLQVPTHVVVVNAIRYTGAKPIYVDCEADSCNIDLAKARGLVSPRTKVLLLQHTFGVPVDLDAALAFAGEHDLEVVEDCVHALGASFDGRPVGSFGRAAFFSTEETKTISTTMGGLAVTDDDALAEQLRRFQQSCAWPSASLTARYLLKLVAYHLATEPTVHRFTRWLYERVGERQPLPRPTTPEELRGERPRGYERRLSNAQAHLGLRQLLRLEENLAHRQETVAAYRRRLGPAAAGFPRAPERAVPSFVRFPLRVTDRQAAVRAGAPHVVTGTWFTSVFEEADDVTALGYVPGSCPVAEAMATDLVNYPTHGRVRETDVEAIAEALLRAGLVPRP